MMPLFLAIFILGVAAGLRTFTAPAVLWLVRHMGPWAIALAVGALIEYGLDLNPKAPPRTGPFGLSVRIVSAAFCGWAVASSHGWSIAGGVLICVAGAVLGAFGGKALRLKAIDAIGTIPSGLIEDAIAIGVAVLAVSQL